MLRRDAIEALDDALSVGLLDIFTMRDDVTG